MPANSAYKLRLWPAIVILGVEWLLILALGWIEPGTLHHLYAKFFGAIVGLVGLIVWWLFASRVRWRDRWLVLGTFLAAGFLSVLSYHPSIGQIGVAYYVVPAVTTAWVLWLLATPTLAWPARRTGLLAVLVLAWGAFILLRREGLDGAMTTTFHFRWTPTEEQTFLSSISPSKDSKDKATLSGTTAAKPLALQPGDWPGFRGPNRDGKLSGVKIATDWQQHPPSLLWRHRVGPGWSSFAVVGPLIFTQEQRGEEEVTVCYNADTGAEIWVHADTARYIDEMGMAGVGPRGTPTFSEGKVFTLGSTGLLNCLDAPTGRLLWTHNVLTDSGAKLQQWGMAGSPLVEDGIVMVFAGGADGKSVLGYHAADGQLAWSSGQGKISYSSPQTVHLEGVKQVLMSTEAGLTSYDSGSGAVLWFYDWQLKEPLNRVVQPTVLEDGNVLIPTGYGIGTRRVRMHCDGKTWKSEELWTSRALKPYYNDQVAHQGYVYGFDGPFLTCAGIDNGVARWRERGYGNGQVLLITDQNLLLVLTERGEVALVETNPEALHEKARFRAIQGKTWNHPVVAHGHLYVRNSEEAACFQLTLQ